MYAFYIWILVCAKTDVLFINLANFGVLDGGLYGDEAAELELEGLNSEWSVHRDYPSLMSESAKDRVS